VSEVRIVSAQCQAAVAEQNVGIGQLFRHFKLTPNFNLLRAGRYRVIDGDKESAGSAELEAGATSVRYCELNYGLSDNDSDTEGSGGCGRGGGYSLWREYDLYDSDHVHCRITERYTPDFLNLCT